MNAKVELKKIYIIETISKSETKRRKEERKEREGRIKDLCILRNWRIRKVLNKFGNTK